MEATSLTGGFTDPARDGARAFRAAMEVMARPGTVATLDHAAPPAPLSVAAGTLLLVLCDPDTPVWLAGGCDTAVVRDWLAFHTGAPVVAGPDGCAFAVGRWSALEPLTAYPQGTAEYPDRSATLIVELDALAPGGVALEGPGIDGHAALPLPDPAAFRANAARFPLGVDAFFTCGTSVAALPRSTKVLD